MKSTYFILCSLALLLFASCKKELPMEFSFEAFPKVKELVPEEFKTNAPILTPTSLCVTDGSLIIAQSKINDSIITAFPLPLSEKFTCFGKTGNGPDDFNRALNLKQLIPAESGFRILNMGTNTLNFYRVSDGEVSREAVNDLSFDIDGALNNFIFLGEQAIAYSDPMGDTHEYIILKEGQDEVLKTAEIPTWHTFEADEMELPFIYARVGVAKPSGDRFASFYGYFKRFRIYSSEGELIREVTVENGEKEELERDVHDRKIYYASTPIATDDRILVLIPSETAENTKDLHVFNWEGEPIAKYQLGKNIQCIAYDQKTKMLYGCSIEEENVIYTYKLD